MQDLLVQENHPQERPERLITHPKVADAAVFGAPNQEMGEEVKAVVQLMREFEPGRRWRPN